MSSRVFGTRVAKKPHLLVNNALGGELADLRADVEAAFLQGQTEKFGTTAQRTTLAGSLTTASKGHFFYDTTLSALYVWTGAAFSPVVGVQRQVSIAGAALPAAGTTMHAQDVGGGVLNLVAGFTVPLPGRTMNIARSNAGPASVNYTITWVLADGTTSVEVLAVPKNSNATSLRAGVGVTSVTTTVDPVSTSDFTTGTGFSVGSPFGALVTLSVSGVVEAAASSHAASGTIVPTTAPNGTRAYTALVS